MVKASKKRAAKKYRATHRVTNEEKKAASFNKWAKKRVENKAGYGRKFDLS